MSKTIYIGGRLESKEKGNVVTGANAILDDTKGKKQNVINKETDDELARLEQSKQDNLNFDSTPTENSTNPVTSGGVYTAEKALSDAIEAILLLIPSAATALNKLVDTNTMNSSISTATATFRGTYNAVSDLGLTYQATHAQIEAALDALGLIADNNDFAFVQIPVSDQSQDIAKTERFKFNGTNWLYEYDLNTSGFTAAQWAAINSGITVALVTKLTDLPTAAALQLALNAKQDTLTFDNEPTALSQNPVTSGGIFTAIQAVATALSNYSTATDNRLGVLEGLVPSEASSSNKLTDKAYVDGLIQAITELIPAEASTTNQLADKAYVLAQILAATPAFKGQFVTLAELQAVASPKAGDLGIVRTKDSDGMDVFTVYQYLSNAWNVFYSLSYHPQTKPATTGTTGDYPYNGMGRVELAKNMVNTGTELAPVMVNQLTQDMFYKGEVGSRVPNTNTIFVIRYDYELAENITIPSGCVLQFDGGSISGEYTITGTNSYINSESTAIFGLGVTFAGTWGISDIIVDWFNDSSDADKIQRAILSARVMHASIQLLSRNYTIDKSISIDGVLDQQLTIRGSSTKTTVTCNLNIPIFTGNLSFGLVEDIMFFGNSKGTDSYCFLTTGGYDSVIRNCSFYNFDIALHVGFVQLNVIDCNFNGNNIGISICKKSSPATCLNVEKCIFTENATVGLTDNMYPNTTTESGNVNWGKCYKLSIIDSIFEINTKGFELRHAIQKKIENCWFERNTNPSQIVTYSLISINNYFSSESRWTNFTLDPNDYGWGFGALQELDGESLKTKNVNFACFDDNYNAVNHGFMSLSETIIDGKHRVNLKNNNLNTSGIIPTIDCSTNKIPTTCVYAYILSDGTIKYNNNSSIITSVSKDDTGQYTVTMNPVHQCPVFITPNNNDFVTTYISRTWSSDPSSGVTTEIADKIHLKFKNESGVLSDANFSIMLFYNKDV